MDYYYYVVLWFLEGTDNQWLNLVINGCRYPGTIGLFTTMVSKYHGSKQTNGTLIMSWGEFTWYMSFTAWGSTVHEETTVCSIP